MSSLAKRYDALKSRMQNYKQESKAIAKVGLNSTATVMGGAAAGFLHVKKPMLWGDSLPTAAVAGASLIGVAMTGMFDEYGEGVAAFGAGLTAGAAAIEVADQLRARG